MPGPCSNSFRPIHARANTLGEADEKLNRIQDAIRASLDQTLTCLNARLALLERAPTGTGTGTISATSGGTPGSDGGDGVIGEPGPPGRDGRDGRDGAPGIPGDDGADGRDGSPGIPGRDGRDGAMGIPGQDGEDGSPGIPGDDGADGAAGAAGTNGQTVQCIPFVCNTNGYADGSLYAAPASADWQPFMPFWPVQYASGHQVIEGFFNDITWSGGGTLDFYFERYDSAGALLNSTLVASYSPGYTGQSQIGVTAFPFVGGDSCALRVAFPVPFGGSFIFSGVIYCST